MVFHNIHITSRNTFEINSGYQPLSSLFYIINGKFRIKLFEDFTEIKKGDVIYLPSTLYFEREIIEPIEFYYVCFSSDTAYHHLGGILNIKDILYFEKTLQLLLQARNKSHITKNIKNKILENLFCQSIVERNLFTHVSDTHIHTCLEYIEKNFDKPISLDTLCNISGYAKTTLIQKFKQNCNTTPINYINNLRIEKSKEYLINKRISISDIAYKCGFESPYYFSNTFKKICSESPSKYREKHLL